MEIVALYGATAVDRAALNRFDRDGRRTITRNLAGSCAKLPCIVQQGTAFPTAARPPSNHFVFLSYSRQDLVFAKALTERLHRISIHVWRDEEEIPAGRRFREEILKGIRRSTAGLFLVSNGWLESDDCRWEAEQFILEHGRSRPMIPLERTRPWEERLPPVLNGLNAIPCHDSEPTSELLGAIQDALEQAEPEPPFSRRAGLEPWTLRMGRSPSWRELDAHAPLKRHEALFIQGASLETPEVFLEAVEQEFPKVPPRRIFAVYWDGPQAPADLRAELAGNLYCDSEAALPGRLRRLLKTQNLVLVHKPVLLAKLAQKPLVDYYTEILPSLLPAPQEVPHFLKVVQGIDWTPAGWLTWLLASATNRFWPFPADWVQRVLEQDQAQSLFAELQKEAHARLPFFPLPPLDRITRKDVEVWSRRMWPGEDHAARIREILRGARTSLEIQIRAGRYPPRNLHEWI